jgi:hypothetical protein
MANTARDNKSAMPVAVNPITNEEIKAITGDIPLSA